MGIKIPVMEIDSACAAPDMAFKGINGNDIAIELVEDKEYKYLTAMPGLTESGDYLALCSKDMENWALCMGAMKGGEKIDLIAFAKTIEIGFPELRELLDATFRKGD